MVFFTDLDSTIVYSHRHEYDKEKVWIETLNGKNQSYITKVTLDYLKTEDKFSIVPITTRTLTQFNRLKLLMYEMNIRHAIICNGAILLKDGRIDDEWLEESKEICREDLNALERIYDICINNGMSDIIVNELPFFFYIKSKNIEEDFAFILSNTNKAHVTVLRDKRKIYVLSHLLTKGNAIERYIRRFSVDKCIAAGDSEFDLSMFSMVEKGFYPRSSENIGSNVEVCNDFFSDTLCEKIKEIIGEF